MNQNESIDEKIKLRNNYFAKIKEYELKEDKTDILEFYKNLKFMPEQVGECIKEYKEQNLNKK